MYQFDFTSSGSEGDISSNESFHRLIDDPNNYARELPHRNSRNPKPQYKHATVYEPMAKDKRSRAKTTHGGGTSQGRKITPRRKNVISRFLMECSQTPGKYGRAGSLNWYCELTNQINTPASGRNINLGVPVSNAEVMNWLDHPDFAETFENLKPNETRQQQPVPRRSEGATKDKAHSAPLPPRKRLRTNPPSELEEVASPLLRSQNSTGLLPSTTGSVPQNRSSGDEDTSMGVSIPSSLTTRRCPDQVPMSSETSSTTRSPPEKSAICPGPVTIIRKNLSVDEFRAQAAAFAEQLIVPSIANVKQEKNVEQAEIMDNPEGEVRIGQREPELGHSQTERNKETENVRQNGNQSKESANPDRTQGQIYFPYESLGFRIHQEVQADRNRGLDPVPQDTEMSEEEEARATTQALTSLHNAIDAVRLEFIRLTNLRFHRRAPVAMSVLGFVVDSLISFVANYLNPDEPAEY